MSSIISSLVLLLLCISLHACNARVLGGFHKKTANEFQQKDENLNSIRVSSQARDKPSVPSNAMVNKSKTDVHGNHTPEKGHGFSDVRPEMPQAMVSWKMPVKKRGVEPESAFNLDYLHPRTHPPVHN